jgi:hypothetical protein
LVKIKSADQASLKEGIRDMDLVKKEEFRRAARKPGGIAGLLLLLIGVISAVAGGLALGILLIGRTSNPSTLQVYIAVQFAAAVVLAVLGNYLWYRARVAT